MSAKDEHTEQKSDCLKCFHCRIRIRVNQNKWWITPTNPLSQNSGILMVFCRMGIWLNSKGERKVYVNMPKPNNMLDEYDDCPYFDDEDTKLKKGDKVIQDFLSLAQPLNEYLISENKRIASQKRSLLYYKHKPQSKISRMNKNGAFVKQKLEKK